MQRELHGDHGRAALPSFKVLSQVARALTRVTHAAKSERPGMPFAHQVAGEVGLCGLRAGILMLACGGLLGLRGFLFQGRADSSGLVASLRRIAGQVTLSSSAWDTRGQMRHFASATRQWQRCRSRL